MRYWLIRYFKGSVFCWAVGTDLKYFETMRKTKELKQLFKKDDEVGTILRIAEYLRKTSYE